MAALGVRARWRTLGVRLVLVTLAVVIVCSFGGHLHVGGTSTIPLPWALADRLPVLGQMLPARFSDYAFLIVSIRAAVWLAEARRPVVAGVLAILAVAFSWPALSGGPWNSPTGLPALFTTTAYRHYISPQDVVLVLPARDAGQSMLWQAVTDFRFPIVGGYVLPPEAPNPLKSTPL